MSFDHTFYEIAALVLLASVVGLAGLMLRQPLVVAFIAVGILAGPDVLGIATSTEYIALMAGLSIAVLLFLVGLKLDLKLIRRRRIRRRSGARRRRVRDARRPRGARSGPAVHPLRCEPRAAAGRKFAGAHDHLRRRLGADPRRHRRPARFRHGARRPACRRLAGVDAVSGCDRLAPQQPQRLSAAAASASRARSPWRCTHRRTPRPFTHTARTLSCRRFRMRRSLPSRFWSRFCRPEARRTPPPSRAGGLDPQRRRNVS